MAKAKAEPSLMGEMFQGRLYKPNQGRVVRQVTGLAVALIFYAAAWRLHSTLLIDLGSTLFLGVPGTEVGMQISSSIVRLGVPILISLVGSWLAFRLMNWPPFANFLISVEAEMDKVSWANMEYLKRATVVVLVVMVFLGAYLFVWDILWQQLFMLIGFLDPSAAAS